MGGAWGENLTPLQILPARLITITGRLKLKKSERKTVNLPPYLDAFHRVEDGVNFSGLSRRSLREVMEDEGLHDEFKAAVQVVTNRREIDLDEAMDQAIRAEDFIESYETLE